MTYDVPLAGREGPVPQPWRPVPIGQAAICREGEDITIVSLGVGVHQALAAAETASKDGISSEVIDLRTVSPLDLETLCSSVSKTGRLLVVDEDYQGYGLSGECSALLLEEGLVFQYARVCTQSTIPYAPHLERETLPNAKRILSGIQALVR